MKPLTEKQQEIFAYLEECLREENYMPTVREIADRFGFKSPNAVRDHLLALERKGVIARRPNASRGIELARQPEKPRGLPVVGRVAAGRPIAALENLDGYLELETLYAADRHYALRVHGDSMIDAGIWDGDFAIVRDQPNVENGEIGVAVIEGEATVKKILRHGNLVELIPANDLYAPIKVDLEETDFRIGGKVVGVHRVIR